MKIHKKVVILVGLICLIFVGWYLNQLNNDLKCVGTYADQAGYSECVKRNAEISSEYVDASDAYYVSNENGGIDNTEDSPEKYWELRSAHLQSELKKYQDNLMIRCEGFAEGKRAPCLNAAILNDELSSSSSIRSMAQATLQPVYVEEAKALADAELISELRDDYSEIKLPSFAFKNIDEVNLSLQFAANLREFERRKLKDPDLEKVNDYMVNRFNPCWGIPEGWCFE